MSDDLADAIAIEFLARLVADREAGRLASLADYQRAFPADAALVARLYADATDCNRDAAASTRTLGPYTLVRELGRGGQAVVWLAHDARLGRDVALKVVPRSPLFEDLAPRFRREATLASRLSHPGICAIHDVGADERVAWIAMRYVAGETLASRIARSAAPIPPPEALVIAESVALALHAAHEVGVIHRDVKPANIMLDPSGDPVVLDFGVAFHEHGETLTLAGDAVGTAAYMAPESLVPEGRTPDRRVDVFALGVTLYEMVTREKPFTGPTRDAIVRAILDEEPRDPRVHAPSLPRDLAIVILTALEKDPGRRYHTAAELAADLRRVRAHEPISARPVGVHTRFARFCQRRPALAGSLLALFLVLAISLVVTHSLLDETRAALTDRGRTLDRFVRLADAKRAEDLLARANTLWPAHPDRVPLFAQWLEEAADLLAREPTHRAALAAPLDVPPESASDDVVAAAWLRERTTELLGRLEAVALAVQSIERRRSFALEVDEATLTGPAELWKAAAARVAADERFGAEFRLLPQRGLVPLGPDPQSRLEEFAYLQLGAPPVRDEAGELRLDEDSALVLVLVPGGDTIVGATPSAGGSPLAGAPVDPDAGPYDGPPCRVRLAPFFVAKHELTQAQWRRHTGENPSTYQRGSKLFAADPADSHPVETISWERAGTALAQLGLELPTEAQWEFAARGGAITPWWTGSDRASLAARENLADEASRARGGHEGWRYEPGFDDGAVVHAPIGSFAPNAFGLHDTLGNVREWCRDTWEDWATNPPRDGDGFTTGNEIGRVFRGGSFAHDAIGSRLARRDGLPPHLSQFTIGVRPARAVE